MITVTERFPMIDSQLSPNGTKTYIQGVTQTYGYIEAGSATLSSGNKTVTFTNAFKTGTTPIIVYQLRNKAVANGGKLSGVSVSGFTLVASGGSSATANWIAIGKLNE